MSADPRVTRRRRKGAGYWLIVTLLALLALLALAIGLMFPWGPINGLVVEEARVITVPQGTPLPPGETAQRIAVTFSVPDDLEAFRARKDAGFINAVLSACESDEIANRENVTQRGGYFPPGRVEKLPAWRSDVTRYRYRATFNNSLPTSNGGRLTSITAIDVGGGLCFSLGGGSMWMGKLWSDRIPLKLVTTGTP